MSLMRQFQRVEPASAPNKAEEKRPAHEQPGWPPRPPMVEAATSKNPAAEQQPAKLKPGPKPSGNAKELVSLRLSKEALDKFRATGKGWQARIDEALRKATP